MSQKKRVTIQDLADELNTTPSTISRSLKDHKGISPEMKKKVQELALKRNYRVNTMASGLRTGQSKTIGVIVPMINRDFFSNVIAGIEKEASARNYTIIICQSSNDVHSETQHVKTLIESNVAGIFASLALSSTDLSHFDHAEKLGIPLVFFDRVPKDSNNLKVVIDDAAGAYKATMHLIEMGYRKIAFFSGSDHINIYQERLAGYIKALTESGMKIDPKIIVKDTLEIQRGREEMAKLLKLKKPPNALVASSDYSALGAYTYLREEGMRIPEDFGIVGFGNERVTGLISPGLSSIDQYSIGIGKYAFDIFYERYIIKNTNAPKKIQLESSLIIRGSSLKQKIE